MKFGFLFLVLASFLVNSNLVVAASKKSNLTSDKVKVVSSTSQPVADCSKADDKQQCYCNENFCLDIKKDCKGTSDYKSCMEDQGCKGFDSFLKNDSCAG